MLTGPIPGDATKGFAIKATAKPVHNRILNEKGRQIMRMIRLARPNPVRITGGSGWGKTLLCQMLAARSCVCGGCSVTAERKCSGQEFTVITGTPGLTVEGIVGEWSPTKDVVAGDVPIAFKDGPLTEAARMGKMCFFEELARAPIETQSRLFDILNDTGRTLNIATRDEPVVVHPRFWLIATENPAGSAGYYSQPMDVALMKRFWLHIEINEPIADEQQVVFGLFGRDAAATEAAVNWVTDLRRNPSMGISTRELVMFVKHITAGFTPLEAAVGAIETHYPGASAGSVIRTTTEAHFTARL